MLVLMEMKELKILVVNFYQLTDQKSFTILRMVVIILELQLMITLAKVVLMELLYLAGIRLEVEGNT